MLDTPPQGSLSGWVSGARVVLRPRAVDSAGLCALTRICPGGCFRFDDEGRVTFDPRTCRYCGTCLAICRSTGEVAWDHPTRQGEPEPCVA